MTQNNNTETGTEAATSSTNNNIQKNSLSALRAFLESHKVEKGEDFTHTSLGPPLMGSFYINQKESKQFLRLYKAAHTDGHNLHITERHKAMSPVLIDFDFRQESSERLYTNEQIVTIACQLCAIVSEYVHEEEQHVFILEKPAPRPATQGVYKDGVHIVIPNVITTPQIQHAIRTIFIQDHAHMIDDIKGLTNNIEDVYDKCVIDKNGWFMYGSKKQDEEHGWEVSYEFIYKKHRVTPKETPEKDLIELLSIRTNVIEESRLTPKGRAILKELPKRPIHHADTRSDVASVLSTTTLYTDEGDLARRLVDILNEKRADSYSTWIEVGWCLYNIDDSEIMLDKWIEFSQKSSKFKYGECETKWASMYKGGLGMGTLVMWAKEDDITRATSILSEMRYGVSHEHVNIDMILESTHLHKYEVIKKIFESSICKIMTPACYIEQNHDNHEMYIKTKSDLQNNYENLFCKKGFPTGEHGMQWKKCRFLDHWLKDAKIRTYKLIDFLPPPMVCPDRTLNLWKPFDIDTVDVESSGNVKPFIDHMSILVSHEQKALDFFIKFIAQIVQYPGVLTGICIILKSRQGAGKNMFIMILERIFGKRYVFSTPNPENDIFGRFATNRKYKLLINMDETSGKDTFKFYDRLKNMITSDTFVYEEKGKDAIPMKNCNRFICTTNNDLPVKIEGDDRRFVVFECSNEKVGDKVYFDSLMKYMDDPCNLKAVIKYLRGIDLSNVNWIQDRPITQAYLKMRYGCSCFILRYFDSIVEEGRGEFRKIQASALYGHFTDWMIQYGYTSQFNGVTFGNRLIEYIEESDGAIRKVKERTANYYYLYMEPLKKYLFKKGVVSTSKFVEDK